MINEVNKLGIEKNYHISFPPALHVWASMPVYGMRAAEQGREEASYEFALTRPCPEPVQREPGMGGELDSGRLGLLKPWSHSGKKY